MLAGGEAAALVVIEAVARLRARGDGQRRRRATDESFADGLLEYPQYTRPAEFRGWAVPEVLRSATTPGSPGGGGPRRCAARSTAGPTCSAAGRSTAERSGAARGVPERRRRPLASRIPLASASATRSLSP